MIHIRTPDPKDAGAIRLLLQATFKRNDEADLVEALRRARRVALELVVEDAGDICGQILFSPVSVFGILNDKGIGLAPMAVRANLQRRGIGTALLGDALHKLTQQGKGYVVVLGDPLYYGRFGFHAASEHGLSCEFVAPVGAFQVLSLEAGARLPSGVVRYVSEFDRYKT